MTNKHVGQGIWIFVGVLMALRAFQWGGSMPPGPDLDPGWEVVLEYAAANRWQFGTDLIFTYGVWGFLQGGHGVGEMDLARRLFAVLFAGFAGWSVVGLLRPLPRWVAGLTLFWLFFFGVFDHFVMLTMIYCGVVVEQMPERRLTLPALLLLVGVAFLSHIKFTGFVAAMLVLGVVTLLRIRSGNGGHSLLPLSVFLGGFLLFWLLAGQSVALLPDFITGRWQITSGYTEAMAVQPKPMVFYLGFGALLCFAGAVVLRLLATKITSLLTTSALMAVLLCFLYWKHGFVRADEEHIPIFTFGAWPLFALLYPTAEDLRSGWNWQRFTVIFVTLWSLAAPLSLLSWRLSQSLSLKTKMQYSLESVPQTLGRLPELGQSFAERRARFQNRTLPSAIDLPQIRAAVGQEPTDIFYYRQGVALANGLNYRPRPIMQSYSAYTTGLAEINRAYLEKTAFRHVLYRLETIDNRHPMLDDAPGVALLLHNYRPTLDEKGYLLLEKARPQIATPRWEEVVQGTVNWGEKFDLSRWNTDPLWLTVDLGKSLPGKLRHQLYQLPEVHLKVYLTDGTDREYRFIPALGKPGLLINPLLADHGDILKFWTGDFAARRIRAIEFWLPEAGRRWYKTPIAVTLSRCPDLGRVPDAAAWRERILALHPPPLYFTPEALNTKFPPREVMFAGKPAYMVHAPGSFQTKVPASARFLRGRIGLMESAYTGEGKTDGVTFRVEARGTDGKTRLLWERTLQPRTVPADQGEHRFSIPVDPKRDTTLILTTNPGATFDFDWSVWGQVQFTP